MRVRRRSTENFRQCNAAHPQCNECAVRSIQCVYPDTNAALLRRHADLSAVFELLRTAPEDRARELLGRIRAGADAGEILQPEQGGRAVEDAGVGADQGGQGPTVEAERKDA